MSTFYVENNFWCYVLFVLEKVLVCSDGHVWLACWEQHLHHNPSMSQLRIALPTALSVMIIHTVTVMLQDTVGYRRGGQHTIR